uniref:Transmembrane protein n=1 Tax=Ananas comosus var. bracteatus TaxID=296719 RepID=A0A6V7QUC1_ANACO
MCLRLLVFFCLASLPVVAFLATARPIHAEAKAAAIQMGLQEGAEAPSASSGAEDKGMTATAPESSEAWRRIENRHRRPFDKSIFAAEVMLGGLATAVFGAVVAYIRVTRKRDSENKL